MSCNAADGSWSGGSATCRPDCAALPALPRHTVAGEGCGEGVRLHAGQSCSVRCEAGYAQQTGDGASYTYTCGTTGEVPDTDSEIRACRSP